jgi:hypothetical protein
MIQYVGKVWLASICAVEQCLTIGDVCAGNRVDFIEGSGELE